MSTRLSTQLANVKARRQTSLRTGDATIGVRRSGTWSPIAKPFSLIAQPMTTAAPLDYSTAGLLRVARTNELVNACLRLRADNLITPPLVVERTNAQGEYIAEDEHDLVAMLRAPGPTMDTATLWRCLSVSWDAAGIDYLEPLYSVSGMLKGLNPLDPSIVTEWYDTAGNLTHYEWWPGYGERVVFAPDELIVRRTVLWADPPPLYTALAAVDADSSMTDYIRAFFANAGVPSGVLKVKGTWSKVRAGELQERWVERYGRNGLMQGGPAVLDENADYQRVGANLNELESDTLRGTAETRITMPFGISPILIGAKVGLESSTYSNYESALKAFWDGTMTPLLNEWASWLTRTILPAYEAVDDILSGRVRCRFDTRGVGPYVEDTTALIATAGELFARGAITRNEYRQAAGMPPIDDGNVYLIPTNVVTEDAATKAITGRTRPLKLPAGQVESFLEAAPVVHNVKAAPKPPQRLTGDVQKYLRDQYAKARRLWLAGNDAGTEAVLREIAEQLDSGIALFGVLAPAERKAYADGWKQAANRIDFEAVIDSGDVTAAVDVLAERCVGITETTKKEIAELIVKGAQEQQTDAEIAKALEDLGFDRAKERAPVITRNELRFAANTASLDAFQASGIVSEIEWIAARSEVCDICKELDGVRVPLGSTFPGDIAPADAHVNCRCDFLPITATEVTL